MKIIRLKDNNSLEIRLVNQQSGRCVNFMSSHPSCQKSSLITKKEVSEKILILEMIEILNNKNPSKL